ncbi:MAG: phosphatidylglycerophosphatase A [Arenicellales bacterium]
MSAINPTLLKHPAVLLATGFGSGLSPFAPGTVGTAASLLLFTFLSDTTWPLLALCVVGFFAGIWLCDQTSEKLGVHDHGGIVWDEFIGMWITLLWVPLSLTNIALAFVLFRVFDILKPWPISYLDKNIHGGLGIMVDDVLAGVFAWLTLQLILMFI